MSAELDHKRRPDAAVGMLAALAACSLAIHLAIAGRYGWFRDELYYIAAGNHLAGGYVEFPPMVALLSVFQRALFGHSMAALLILPALASAALVVVVGLMARELGGGRLAQGIAALTALVAPAFVGSGALFTMDVFDEVWWTIAELLAILILRSRYLDGAAGSRRRARLWLLFGLIGCLGLLTKLTFLAFGLALTVGLLLSRSRPEMRTPWPYLAGVVAFLGLVPYAIWQLGHDWATLTFWHNYGHTESTPVFLIQVLLLLQPLAAPLWIAGLWYLLRSPKGEPYRPLGWAFLFLLALFVAGHAKSYFLVPAFPPLIAAGAVVLEQRAHRRPGGRLVRITIGAQLLGGIVLAPVVAPVLPPKTLAAVMSSPIQPVADRFGWPQLMTTVANVYHGLPAADRAGVTILAGNYGEAAAFELLGADYGLPRAISPHNTYYFWDKGVTPGPTVIATGYARADLTPYFREVRDAAIVPAEDGIQNEEVGRHVYVCRGLLMPWARAWTQLKNFS